MKISEIDYSGCLCAIIVRLLLVVKVILVGSDADVHVLDNQVGRAIVKETAAHVLVIEQRAELLKELSLTVVFKDDILGSLDDSETLIEGRTSVLAAHEGLELWEFT